MEQPVPIRTAWHIPAEKTLPAEVLSVSLPEKTPSLPQPPRSIDENAELSAPVAFKAQHPLLEEASRRLGSLERERMARHRQQQLHRTSEKQPSGSTSQHRAMDLSVQLNRSVASLSNPLDDQNFINKMLNHQKLYEDDIPDIVPSSEEFGEAFLNAHHDFRKHSDIEKEDKDSPGQQEKDTDSSSQQQHQPQIFLLEEDEMMGLSLEEQIEHRIMAISESLDRKTGEPASLIREIEKRLNRIGTFIDKKPAPAHQAKLFNVPSSTRVQHLRNKFGKR